VEVVGQAVGDAVAGTQNAVEQVGDAGKLGGVQPSRGDDVGAYGAGAGVR
jgi:hypothetical protein